MCLILYHDHGQYDQKTATLVKTPSPCCLLTICTTSITIRLDQICSKVFTDVNYRTCTTPITVPLMQIGIHRIDLVMYLTRSRLRAASLSFFQDCFDLHHTSCRIEMIIIVNVNMIQDIPIFAPLLFFPSSPHFCCTLFVHQCRG